MTLSDSLSSFRQRFIIWLFPGALLIPLGGAICACMRNLLSVTVSQNFAMDLRQDVYVKIQRFSMKNIDDQFAGLRDE
ncbi:ABC transporter ATP-binding protein [Sporolactobacillus vineae]|uniref:ABC transporter ATP-binding protein n=1 Tax=Sporolactobacillus vineae TaxID=444463 RepID=UPI000287C9C0|nr:ABC transporter ATP-binding protein [Sporolactobacillus vineae]